MKFTQTSLARFASYIALPLSVCFVSQANGAESTEHHQGVLGNALWIDIMICMQDSYASGDTLKTAFTSCTAEVLSAPREQESGQGVLHEQVRCEDR
jgi:hypothetical protein